MAGVSGRYGDAMASLQLPLRLRTLLLTNLPTTRPLPQLLDVPTRHSRLTQRRVPNFVDFVFIVQGPYLN